jgi:hypothetical protein
MHDQYPAVMGADPGTDDTSTLSIRASSFGGLFDCALRWEQIHLNGLANPAGPRALIGTGVHAGSAAFDQARLEKAPISLDDAVGFALDEMAERIADGEVVWSGDEPNRKEVEKIATRVTLNYCADISPRYEFEAVELTTKPLDIDCGGGMIVRLTGTLDRARTVVQTAPWLDVADPQRIRRRIADVKTGGAVVGADGVVATKKHRPQCGTYEMLYEHSTGLPITDGSEVIGLNTKGRFNTGHGIVRGAKQLLLGTDAEPGLILRAAAMFRTGMFNPNPQSMLCSAKYCPYHNRCPYSDHD